MFVTPHGRWRLAGLEGLAKFQLKEQERARDIQVCRSSIYARGLSKNKRKNSVQALGLLITQLLADSSDREAAAFREFARTQVGKVHSMCAGKIPARSKLTLTI